MNPRSAYRRIVRWSPGVTPNIDETMIRKLPKRTALVKKLEEIRRDGMSWTEGGLAPGLNAYAVPVYDHQDDVYGALTLLVPTAQARQAKSAIAKLRAAALETSLTLGYQAKPGTTSRTINKRPWPRKPRRKRRHEVTAARSLARIGIALSNGRRDCHHEMRLISF
jgi:hypothetical protein